MTLKLKVSLILAVVFLALWVGNAVVLWQVLWPSFTALEQRSAERDLRRVRDMMAADQIALSGVCRDWASWDDTYRFLQERDEEFLSTNLVEGTFTSLNIDFLLLLDLDGRPVAGLGYDPEAGILLTLETLPLDWLASMAPRLSLRDPGYAADAVVATARGPALVSIHPVLTSAHTGPSRGGLAMGRFLTEQRVEQLSARVQLPLSLVPDGEHQVKGGYSVDVEQMTLTHPLNGLDGQPVAGFTASIPREVTQSGMAAINYALVLLLVTGAAVLVAVLLVVHRLIVRPVTRLTGQVTVFAERVEPLPLPEESRGDEIGLLAREFRRMRRRISRLAYFDALTGLPNRVTFTEHLRHALARAERSGSRGALFFLDLDGFKRVNDGLGHAVGDAVLQGVANRFREGLRECDVIGRLGGDEFTVLIEDVGGPEQWGQVAEKIIALLSEPFEVAGQSVAIGTSVGIALFPEHGQDVEALLHAADVAMYRAKRAGKGGYQLYAPVLEPQALGWERVQGE